ncbi:MAG: hypothetical protein A2Y21_03715 [Clostridiales bacterium GWC2_40_7]|nr:MAG: hypothetical protein A2Y21_03715 [Clostridiales bacterium GWC2_40_7]
MPPVYGILPYLYKAFLRYYSRYKLVGILYFCHLEGINSENFYRMLLLQYISLMFISEYF